LTGQAWRAAGFARQWRIAELSSLIRDGESRWQRFNPSRLPVDSPMSHNCNSGLLANSALARLIGAAINHRLQGEKET
jgi:hypothetical protein